MSAPRQPDQGNLALLEVEGELRSDGRGPRSADEKSPATESGHVLPLAENGEDVGGIRRSAEREPFTKAFTSLYRP